MGEGEEWFERLASIGGREQIGAVGAMRTRPGFLRQVAPLLAAFGLVGGIALYLRYASESVRPVDYGALIVETLPEAPSLMGWPPELVERLDAAYDGLLDKERQRGALAELALLYHANGFLAQANACYLGLQVMEPQEARWPYLMAVAREDYGDQALVVEDLARANMLDPGYGLVALKLGEAYLRLGNGAEARRYFERYLARVGEDPWALVGLGKLALGEGDFGGARELLERALAVDGRFAAALELLPEVCIELGDVAAAREYRLVGEEKGRARRPRDERWEGLAEFCYDAARLRMWAAEDGANGRWESAGRRLKRAWELDGGDAETLAAMGEWLLEGGKMGQWPGEFPIRAVAGALRDEGRRGEAEAALRLALEVAVEARRSEALFELGLLLMETRPEEGVVLLEDYLKGAPEDAATWMAVGLYYLSKGEVGAGVARLERAWALEPGLPGLGAELERARGGE